MIEAGELYLDHDATVPIVAAAREAMERALRDRLVNPASPHPAGQRSRRLLEAAREDVARAIGAQPGEIVFTSGGTESNHLALLGAIDARSPKRHVVVSAIEHSSTLAAARRLADSGVSVTTVPPRPDGAVEAGAILAAIRPETALVCLMWANNETGALQPVETVSSALAARSIPLHVDAVQAAGRVGIDVARAGAATLSLSSHKLGGPTGAGALWVRSGHRLTAWLGGGRQERGLRGGTHNLLGIVGFAAAAREIPDRVDAAAATALVRDRFEAHVRAGFPELRVAAAGIPRLPNTSSITLPGCDAARLVGVLGRAGVHVSTGSACQAGSPEISHVLRAMGYSAAAARATLRVSFGSAPDPADAGRAADAILAAVAASRSHPSTIP